MPQEPWKRAHQLSRMVPPDARPRGAAPPPRPRKPLFGVVAGVLLIGLLGAAGWLAYPHIPRFWERTSPPASITRGETTATETTGPTVTVDTAVLEEGLGIGLAPLADYLEVIELTKEAGITWELKTTGGGTLRMTAPGIVAYVDDGKLRGYTLDVPVVFGHREWSAVQRELRRAGITPELMADAVMGEGAVGSNVSLEGARVAETRRGWVYPVYDLRFAGGTLKLIRAGLRIGPARVAGPQDAPAG
jgi:hypothetical protein